MIQLVVRIPATPRTADRIADALRTVMLGLRADDACAEAHATKDVVDPDVFWLCEQWADNDALEKHLRSDRFGRVLAVMEMAADTPSLECRVVSETRGLDYVAAVRGVVTRKHRLHKE